MIHFVLHDIQLQFSNFTERRQDLVMLLQRIGMQATLREQR